MAEGDKGIGQQDPSNSTADFNVRDFQIAQAIATIATVKIVKVEAVDADKKEVDVLILVNLIDGAGNKTASGKVSGLSYAGQQWGDFAIVAPPKIGDIGVIVCADRDTSAVKSAKAQANPGSGRQLDAADGLYIGGIPGLNTAPVQTITADADGMAWQDRNGNIFKSDSTGFHFNKPTFFADVVDVTGAATLRSTLDVKGIATFEVDAAVDGNLTVDGNLIVVGTSHLEGNVQIDGTTTVNGTSHLVGTITADHDIDVGGKLVVTGAIWLGGILAGAAGGTYAQNIHTSGTITSDTEVLVGSHTLTQHKHGGVTTGGGFTIAPVG